ncbi:MAG TPA: serine hydrolase domain-containing protein [Longimicrobiales bacterium]|nr:serine hydrolase domain-containing protein [Longimicrobiales bacterium]
MSRNPSALAPALFLLLLLFGMAPPLAAQQPMFDLERVRPAIEAAIRAELEQGTSSVSIALVSGDRVVWTAAYGNANATTRTAATPATIYSTGSTGKSVTAAAIMKLVEQGRVSLDQPVNRYLQGARVQDRLQSETPVTVRMLLSHTSGLTCDAQTRPVYSRTLPPSLKELTERTYSIRAPGERYEYCNSAYGIAGYLIEQVTGQDYESFILEHILKPLGVTTASPVNPTAEMADLMAQPYRRGENGQPVPVSRVFFDVVPAGDMYMTAEDMARFLGALLNGGVFNGVRILSQESVAEMQRNQSPPMTGATETASGRGYGLGLSTRTTPEGHIMIQHGGSVPGLNAHMIGNVTLRIGVYVMTNSAGHAPIAAAAMDAMHAALRPVSAGREP